MGYIRHGACFNMHCFSSNFLLLVFQILWTDKERIFSWPYQGSYSYARLTSQSLNATRLACGIVA